MVNMLPSLRHQCALVSSTLNALMAVRASVAEEQHSGFVGFRV